MTIFRKCDFMINQKSERPKLRNIILIFSSIILACTITAFVFTLNNEPKEISAQERVDMEIESHYVLIGQDKKNPMWQKIYKGAEEAASSRNVALEYYCPEMQDVNKEIRYFDMSVEANVDGIIVTGYEDETFKEISRKATERGIPVVFINEEGHQGDRIAYIGPNNYLAGIKSVDEIQKCNVDEPKVAILVGNESIVQSDIRLSSIRQEIAKYDDIEIVSINKVANSRISLFTDIKAMLRSNPEINIIIGTHVYHGEYIGQVLVDLNRVGKVKVIAFDDTEETIRYISKGVIHSTLDVDNHDIGYKSVDVLKDHQLGSFTRDVYHMDLSIMNQDSLSEGREGVLNE